MWLEFNVLSDTNPGLCVPVSLYLPSKTLCICSEGRKLQRYISEVHLLQKKDHIAINVSIILTLYWELIPFV